MNDKERIEQLENDVEAYKWMLTCAMCTSEVQEQNFQELKKEIPSEEIQERHKDNLRTLDAATNWIGEFSDRSIADLAFVRNKLVGGTKAATAIENVLEELQELWDGYHTVGGEYPWNE